LRKVDKSYDPGKRYEALSYMNDKHEMGEIVTGLLYLDPLALDLHASLNSTHLPLNSLQEKELCPGKKVLSQINQSLR